MEKCGGSFLQRLFEYLCKLFRIILFKVLSIGPIPQHIAFIMDGNRRFARKLKLKSGAGHQIGFWALISVLQYCHELGVKYVTVYAFSIDNFRRSPDEVQLLMDLMLEKMEELLDEESLVNRFGIKVNIWGNLDLLSAPVKRAAEKVMLATAENQKAVLSVCIAYTCTHEIVHSIQESCRERLKKVQEKSLRNGISSSSLKCPENVVIEVSDLESHMYTSGIPDPDMLIRTSGEGRLSNFLLWQTSLCNLITTKILWPGFSLRYFVWGILEYQRLQPYLAKKKRQCFPWQVVSSQLVIF